MEDRYKFVFKNQLHKKKDNTKIHMLNNYVSKRLNNEPNNNNEKSIEYHSVNEIEQFVKNKTNEARTRAFSLLHKSKQLIRNKNNIKNTNNHKVTKNKSFNNLQQINKKNFSFKRKKLITIKNETYKKTKNIKDSFIQFLKIIKQTYITVTNLISLGTGTLLLIFITLFIGVFACLSDTNAQHIPISPLSEEVLACSDIIREYAILYEIEDYVPLVQAIMMKESKGLGNDPMNVKHILDININDTNQSIQLGVKYLSECIQLSHVQSPLDKDNLYLAIQAYNFKKDYITWAINNFDGYSKYNAQVYNDIKKEGLNMTNYGDINYVTNVIQYIDFSFGIFRLEPNFDNHLAWGNNNPYSRAKLYGQCTWFAWGRFYELYGYSPEFLGNGWDCAKQLVNAHPDKFQLSSNPEIGAIYSCIGRNHVGIVVGWDGTNITIQEGNLDNKTNTFNEAKHDWQTVTYEIGEFRRLCRGVEFAVSK